MEPSIKQINVRERVEFSHISVRKNYAIIHFKECSDQLVILDEFIVKTLHVELARDVFKSELEDPRIGYGWYKVEIECYYHTPIKTICLCRFGSPETNEGEPIWIRGFDPYSAFVNVIYKSMNNKALIVR